MGGICTLAFEKQDWGIVPFLVCIVVLIFTIVLGIYFDFIFTAVIGALGSFLGLRVLRLGSICVRL
jgi:uncharacterized membrane protein